MSRWQWGLVALPAAVVAAVLVVAWPGGPGGGESHAGVEEIPYAYIDKNIHNGDGPCDPDYIDDATVETVGSTHQLAVCIAGFEPAGRKPCHEGNDPLDRHPLAVYIQVPAFEAPGFRGHAVGQRPLNRRQHLSLRKVEDFTV